MDDSRLKPIIINDNSKKINLNDIKKESNRINFNICMYLQIVIYIYSR